MSFAAAAFDFVIAHQSSTWEIEIGTEVATLIETGEFTLVFTIVLRMSHVTSSRFQFGI